MSAWGLCILAILLQPTPRALVCSNPLSGLPPLKKTHYSWPLPFVDEKWLGGAQVDFARITGSLPLYLYSDCGVPEPGNNSVGQNSTEVFSAVRICHLAQRNGSAAPVLALNWSPWYSCFEAPGGEEIVMGDPRVEGATEARYLNEWRTRLQLYKSWVADANEELGTSIRVGAVLLDSERFWFNCSESPPWGSPGHPFGPYAQYCSSNATYNKEWFDAIARKHDLTTGLVQDVFGRHVDIEFYGRGSVHVEPTGPPFVSPHFTLQERAPRAPLSAILYSIFEPAATRADYNATVFFLRSLASAKLLPPGVDETHVTPWVALGSGNRRNFTRTVYAHEYNYDRQLDWGLGYEIDNSIDNLGAPWSAAEHVVFFPSPFECQGGEHGSAGGSPRCPASDAVKHGATSIMLSHFVSYVHGAAKQQTLGMASPALASIKTDDEGTDVLPPTRVLAPFLHGDDEYDSNGWRETAPGMVLQPDGSIAIFFMRKSGNYHSPGDHKSPGGTFSPTDGYGYSTSCVNCELMTALSTNDGRSFHSVSRILKLPQTAGDNESLAPSGWWARGGVTIAAPRLREFKPVEDAPADPQQTVHLFMGKYIDINQTSTHYHPALTVWHLRLRWNGTTYLPTSAAPKQIARDDDNGTPRSAVQLPSGRIIYGHADNSIPSAAVQTDGLLYGVLSDDGGHTWQRSRAQKVPMGYELVEMGLAIAGGSVMQQDRATLWAVMRSERDKVYPSLWESYSTDDGASFSVPKSRNTTGRRLVSDSTPATPVRLRDGRLVLLWCNGLTTNQTYPTRQMLHAAVSSDGGKTFTRGFREIYRSIFSSTNFSGRTDYGAAYPFAIETQHPGRLLVATGQGYATQVMFLVDVAWITGLTQQADYRRTPPPPSTPLFPRGKCNVPPCEWNSHGQVVDPRDFTGSFCSTFNTPVAASIQDGVGLVLAGQGSAFVWNFPAASGGGRLSLTLRLSLGGSVVVALADHFSDPIDEMSDVKGPSGCAVHILSRHTQDQNVTVEWVPTADATRTITCRWEQHGRSDQDASWPAGYHQYHNTTAIGSSEVPSEGVLSYVRIRPAAGTTVTIQKAEAQARV